MVDYDINVVGYVAAQPGYYVLSVSGGDDGEPFMADKEAVLVWVIERSASIYVPHPMTQGGIKIDAPVLRPDGTVTIGDAEWWSDATDWLADRLEALAIQRKQDRWDACRKQHGLAENVEQADKPVHATSSARAVIHAALTAARTGKVTP